MHYINVLFIVAPRSYNDKLHTVPLQVKTLDY